MTNRMGFLFITREVNKWLSEVMEGDEKNGSRSSGGEGSGSSPLLRGSTCSGTILSGSGDEPERKWRGKKRSRGGNWVHSRREIYTVGRNLDMLTVNDG